MVEDVAAQLRWVIKAVVAGRPTPHAPNEFGTDLILVDAPSPGSGKVFDWTLFSEVPEGPRSSSPAASTPTTSREAVRVPGRGVSTCRAGVEKSPGASKDPLKVKAFIERARASAPRSYLGPDEMPYDWADDDSTSARPDR
jgi:phosphoribosylanthranilate isomerase